MTIIFSDLSIRNVLKKCYLPDRFTKKSGSDQKVNGKLLVKATARLLSTCGILKLNTEVIRVRFIIKRNI